ncbi:CNT family concentrative nucleoside transporter [Sphingomonas naasensis]|uniref:NupC/NupG family nucleoside CNT transporter n=1 Tax=Sphingomonas naasensis TaxID=1344951 RepID=A0A4S1WKE1_9SPHN|nr:nucleoside transporter C-terminal domain-containing protein [Sphingomonas naasensis]NIJ22004.1 CNT family concentrative nucleoside transporter [Sphingomonas naasensis]TGX42317.1 NupC/NupG family nucleoside CNT transporter [Sphingomonas naasensis]
MNQFPIGIFGIIAILAIAWLLSSNRRAIRLRVVGAAFALQAGVAFLVLRTDWGQTALHALSNGVSALLGYAGEGTAFLFGPLAKPELGGQSFAIAALPVIIFFAALVSILYHLGVMQFVIRWIGGAIEKVVGTSKVESLCAAANIFVGQSESPLVIRPYLARLTPSQLFAVMTVGMAGVAGTILAAYASLLGPASLPYLLAASFMAAPGGLLMAKIIMPDDLAPAKGELPLGDDPEDEAIKIAEHDIEEERAANLIMAAATGASTGVKIAVAVGAMVLAFVALVALANGLLGGLGNWIYELSGHAAWAQWFAGLSFQKIIGTIFAPVMFLLGISWHEAVAAGGLFGTKVVLNEFVAFIDLGQMKDLAPRTVAIITFALCGFANFSSIAIQMAATGSLAPNQRPMIARLGIKALIAGSLANLMSAALAGLLLQ